MRGVLGRQLVVQPETRHFGALLSLDPAGVAQVARFWELAAGAVLSDFPAETVGDLLNELICGNGIMLYSADRATVLEMRRLVFAVLDRMTGETAEMAAA